MITKKVFSQNKNKAINWLKFGIVGYVCYTIKHEAYLTYIFCNFGGVVENVLYAISEF